MRLKANSFVLAVAIVATTATSVQAQEKKTSGFVESWNTVSEAGTKPQLNVYVRGQLKGRVGWSAFTLTTETWSQAYAGLTFAPAKWVEVSASLGLENANSPLREGASVWLGKGRWTLLSIHEHGGSGYWYSHRGKFQMTKTVAVGVISQRFLGTGPYAEKKFGKVALWGIYVIGNDVGVAGIRFNF